jgi:hypothetical protein
VALVTTNGRLAHGRCVAAWIDSAAVLHRSFIDPAH